MSQSETKKPSDLFGVLSVNLILRQVLKIFAQTSHFWVKKILVYENIITQILGFQVIKMTINQKSFQKTYSGEEPQIPY